MAAVDDENVPAGHKEHPDAPPNEKDPALQAVHDAEELELAVPAAHDTQAEEEPLFALYDPATHAMQSDALDVM